MPINGRTKGHDAERDIARRFNEIVETTYRQVTGNELPEDWTPQVQRNQNQSAVGGDDLIGTYGFSIEVKRQEALSLDKWWKQACLSAGRQGKTPVVIFKQNRKPWRVLMGGGISHPLCKDGAVAWITVPRLEVSLEDFERLFTEVCRKSL